ncbi:hypothetical protein HMPREF1214_04188 [Bacteroides sp. HPS0048]|uniref:helix-turn-helix domain-containing protein n=1 Tax=Bacteroides sp. HPS0048 TaxID=1078089 RepID=UPI00035C43A2|nr:helix-turn-helix domain-containing protein [Bacteroides sp. HPS0048]EOA54224.1 hypothetical protein HMPREF1214_04188 [Bacteroides sp. HPS0048]
MNIIKHCKCCGVQFVAHRMATLYCSKACNAKATRVRKKKNLEKEYQELQDDIELSQETTAAPAEFLSPSQAAILLGVSRATIYRYALAGTIKAVQFRGLTIIRKSDIEKAFDNAPDYKKRPSFSKKKEDSEYYTTSEISEKYHIRRKAILARCERFNIPKVYEGRGKSSVRCPLKPKRFYPLKIFNNAPSKSLDRWGYYYFSLFPSVCRHLPDTFSV